MTPNPLYQALVEALESQLPPRVVSRVLREGMAPTGATPETLTHEVARGVLRGPVFRQLQAHGQAPNAAKSLVSELEAYIAAAVEPVAPPSAAAARASWDGTHADGPTTAAAATGAAVLDEAAEYALNDLRGALRPFNLYFSWPEVRKLRSLVQLADDEVRGGGDAAALLTEAESQLQLVRQKLEDLLVLQARTLADLEAALEAVEPLGTPAVRRLDALIATVREAQGRRMLVEAEAERAEKLARELRKLVESTVLEEGRSLPDLGRGDGRPRAPTLIDVPRPATGSGADDGTVAADALAGALPPDAQDRLRALDLEGEAHDLDALAARHAELLRHVPALAEELTALRAEQAAGRVLGERLTRVAGAWQAQATARQHALRHELEAVRDEVEALPAEVDATELRRALTVALDVLGDGLLAVEDLANVRELQAAALARAERLRAEQQERDARRAERQAQIATVRARLEEAWQQAPDQPRLAAARERLQAAVASLAAAIADEDAASLLELAWDAEAAWQRALAEASDDQSARRRARVRELLARIAHLPDIPNLRARTLAVRREAEGLEAGAELGRDQLRALTHLTDQLIGDARGAVAARLEEMAHEAGDPAPDALLRALQVAARQLDDGGFPDLQAVEREVQATRDERRAAIRRRYLRARQESHRLADAGVPAAAGLADLVGQARSALDGDAQPEAAVERLERRLAGVVREMGERLDTFLPRLDTALAAFRGVARLNNDDVAAVRRVLHHLDGQRHAIGRVSPGLQAQLFASLSEAEETLGHLQAAFEATRAIADQLVAGNRLDDVLGSLDAMFGAPDDAAEAPAVDGAHDELRAWLDGYLRLDDVDGAAVLTSGGRLIIGRMPTGTDAVALGHAIDEMLGAWTALGERLGDEAPEVAFIEVGGRPTWVAPLADQGCAVVWSQSAATGGRLGARLRDDRRAVVEMLRSVAAGGDAGAPDG